MSTQLDDKTIRQHKAIELSKKYKTLSLGKDGLSKVLGLHYSRNYNLFYDVLDWEQPKLGVLTQFKTSRRSENVYKFLTIDLDKATLLSPQKLETTVLNIVTNSKFNDFLVDKGDVTYDFSKLPTHTINKLIDYIMKCEKKRISYSWVAPLQDLLFDLQEKSKKQVKKGRAAIKGSVFDDDIPEYDVEPYPEPKSATISPRTWARTRTTSAIGSIFESSVENLAKRYYTINMADYSEAVHKIGHDPI